MSSAAALARALDGISAPEVTVEVHLSNGLPSFSIVGLPEIAIRESKERVRSALLSSGFEFPQRRITVNLAPADLRKHGTRFDLPIALGLLAASEQIPVAALEAHEFIGELALDGSIRHVPGVLPATMAARQARHILVVPAVDIAEAVLIPDLVIYGAKQLITLVDHLTGVHHLMPQIHTEPDSTSSSADADLADVRGQFHAKRALEVAAAGGHNLLMIGPPGTGKTMLARRLPGLLPPMTDHEALEAAAIGSIAGGTFDARRWRRRPFRAPHHTASTVAIVGGGTIPRPGEISLSHQGVLFLDELPEFRRDVLEALREPMEEGSVTIARAAQRTTFPARFQLVAAMNPCPCGHAGDRSDRCRCNPDQLQRYFSRVSGPLLDRFDIHIEVPRETEALWSLNAPEEASSEVGTRVRRARAHQHQRAGCINAGLPANAVMALIDMQGAAGELLRQAAARYQLSARSIHRLLRVARTIADLADAESISDQHIAEAISLRCLDRKSHR